MKTLVIGLPYFAKMVAKNLSDIDFGNKYISLNPSEKLVDRIRFLLHLPFADVVYLIGASTSCGGSLKSALLLKKKIVMHWVGTDVLVAHKAFKNKKIDHELLKRARHLCIVSWLQEELKQIGIHADIVPITGFENEIPDPQPLPEKFSILSYVGKTKEQAEFYGVKHLIRLAIDFPHIEIKIAGKTEYDQPLPDNIKILGWITDMASHYKECVLYLRLTEHDGISFMVLEALSHGRYVARSQEHEICYFVPTYAHLKDIVEKLYLKHQAGTLKENREGFCYIRNNFNKMINMQILSNALRDARYDG
jgi:hypothetical protein